MEKENQKEVKQRVDFKKIIMAVLLTFLPLAGFAIGIIYANRLVDESTVIPAQIIADEDLAEVGKEMIIDEQEEGDEETEDTDVTVETNIKETKQVDIPNGYIEMLSTWSIYVEEGVQSSYDDERSAIIYIDPEVILYMNATDALPATFNGEVHEYKSSSNTAKEEYVNKDIVSNYLENPSMDDIIFGVYKKESIYIGGVAVYKYYAVSPNSLGITYKFEKVSTSGDNYVYSFFVSDDKVKYEPELLDIIESFEMTK